MARSRLEKIGTIFDRVTGLLKSNAMRVEDKPIWYEVYKAFPPTHQPRFDRPAPNIPIRNIFYEEDVIRAEFHKAIKRLPAVNVSSNQPSLTQRFIDIYNTIRNDSGLSNADTFNRAFEQIKLERKEKVNEDGTNDAMRSEKLQKQNIKELFDN